MSYNSLAVFAKRDCPTCQLVAPVIRALATQDKSVKVFSQDDPGFPEQVGGVIDDRDLEQSFRHNIEIVPTLIRFEGGRYRNHRTTVTGSNSSARDSDGVRAIYPAKSFGRSSARVAEENFC